jgi:hypothetical protein
MAKTLILVASPEPIYCNFGLQKRLEDMLKMIGFPVPDVIIHSKTHYSPETAECLRSTFRTIADKTVSLHV